MQESNWQVGDWVVYRKQKSSVSPGPRAKGVFPSPKGEAYHYVVDKYWVVNRILGDGTLELRTRQGKLHEIAPDDFRLRHARWWERFFLADRFPSRDPISEPQSV